jgi:hypothetical protein
MTLGRLLKALGVAAGVAVPLLCPASLGAQAPAAAGGLAQRFAPIDLTGTWVSIVTEDWAVRMITPPKGDFESLPLTRAAQDAANQTDMAQVAAAGRACEAYGAPAIMREPGRVRISWQDAGTLKIETDAGQQTRLLHFEGSAPATRAPSLQGVSTAEWQYANGFDPIRAAAALDAARSGGGAGRAGGGGRGAAGGRGGGVASAPSGGRLKVATTNLAAGFVRKNGVPYSANATMTEYYNLLTEPSGTQWFVVTTILHDPANFAVDYITSSNFRKEPDASKFRPQPCSLR